MSKAILVLDKMPKSCSECPALRWTDIYCDASGIVPTLIEDIFARPACCPLKELPEHITVEDLDKEPVLKMHEEYVYGWNQALDVIERTGD